MILGVLGPMCLAFFVSIIICGLEIVFGKYRQNHHLVISNPKFLILYCFLYGFISAGVTYLLLTNSISVESIKLSDSPYFLALSFGVATKAVAKISIYSFKLEQKSYHVGPKIITDYLDDFLLKRLNDDVDEDLIKKIKSTEKKLKKVGTLSEMDEIIFQILPTNLPKIKLKSYQKEITSNKSAFDKCRYIATAFGLKRLEMLNSTIDNIG